jgi:predicted  nucleic acid-binding Zn-ribbon protein
MLKKLIKPLQNVLIQKKMCPGCTRSLDNAVLINSRSNGTDIIKCQCTRIFVYDKSLDIYRRALNEDL